MIALSITSNIADLTARLRVKQKKLREVMQRDDFGAAVQAYITGATTRFIRDMGDISEAPSAKSLRGVTWPGWAMRQVHKYGQDVPDGTRFRFRGFTRMKQGKGGQYESAAERDAREGRVHGINMGRLRKALKRDVTLTKAWNKRASGRKYSDSSKMMADTGVLLGFTAFVTRRVVTSGSSTSIVMTAGQCVSYFAAQHARRPIWFWYPPDDTPRVMKILQTYVNKVLKEAA